MLDSAKDVACIVFDVLEAHGVREVVCSPGSRNAPLIIAADARQHLKKHVVVDERSAAFVALGISMVERRPVALVCTSGTALLNYAPAVAEAYYQGLPLIVISADRPLEWIDQDDSQTIRQPDSLANFVKGSYTLSDRVQGDRHGWYETRMANDAMLTALAPKQGPVHINVRLSPPLGEIRKGLPLMSPRIIRRVLPQPVPEKGIMRELGSSLIGKKVMVVAGFMEPDARMTKAMNRMRAHENVTVMAETISNIHLPQEDYAIDTVLCTLDDSERAKLAPDVVISCGGALVSRMLKDYLRECSKRNSAMEHWSIGFSHTTSDCFQALTLRIDADPGMFIAALTASIAHGRRISGRDDKTGYAEQWAAKKETSITRMDNFAETSDWSDMLAFNILLKAVPEKSNLFLSNGTSIRYAQLLTRKIPHAEFCNRGVSGIDGSTSTAIGGSLSFPGDTYLITGDTSFSYDLSALQTLSALKANLKIVILNNGGGGIFRFISSTSGLKCREQYFCVDPHTPVQELAKAYGITYFRAGSRQELLEHLSEFTRLKGSAILEVVTPTLVSADILRDALNIYKS